MDSLWATVDQLIHDLGAIRAFIDEAHTVPEASSSPQVVSVRGAMDEATTAITRILDGHGDDRRVVEEAWQAIARAQDAVRAARVLVVRARAAGETAAAQKVQARAQSTRARGQADLLHEQRARLRQPRWVPGAAPAPPDDTPDG
jgi:hypothetical protein